MKEISKDFKKVGGLQKIKDFAREGVLGTVCGEMLLLGTSHKALEIANLSAQLKIYKKLEKRYGYLIDKCKVKEKGKVNRTVWISWLQGIENAPDLVKKCYDSVVKNFEGWNIVVVTLENLDQYTDFPKYILDKFNSGVITKTHFSDLLRIELLTRHGGLWLDATVFCTGTLPEYIEKTDLFFYQVLKPGYTGHINRVSSWVIWSLSGNGVLCETKKLLWTYWEKENRLYDYFLLHYFMTMILNKNNDELQKIIPVSNEAPHVLLLRLFEPYNEKVWEGVKEQTPFHKLSYKYEKEMTNMQGTYYSKIIMGGGKHTPANYNC